MILARILPSSPAAAMMPSFAASVSAASRALFRIAKNVWIAFIMSPPASLDARIASIRATLGGGSCSLPKISRMKPTTFSGFSPMVAVNLGVSFTTLSTSLRTLARSTALRGAFTIRS